MNILVQAMQIEGVPWFN